MRALRLFLILLPFLSYAGACGAVAVWVYGDSGLPVAVVVETPSGFTTVEVAGRSPVLLPPDQRPVLPRSDAATSARGSMYKREGKTCFFNPEPRTTLGEGLIPCYRVDGVGNRVEYQPGGVDDAGSLYQDVYVVDGQTVLPKRSTRLGFVEAALGWVPANLAGLIALRVARRIRRRLP
jgi:hypothetical protein